MKILVNFLILFQFLSCINISCVYSFIQFKNYHRISKGLYMMDEFVSLKLESIKRTFSALTERLADPDLANDRKEMLVISRERASMEPTVLAYDRWKLLEEERLGTIFIILHSSFIIHSDPFYFCYQVWWLWSRTVART